MIEEDQGDEHSLLIWPICVQFQQAICILSEVSEEVRIYNKTQWPLVLEIDGWTVN